MRNIFLSVIIIGLFGYGTLAQKPALPIDEKTNKPLYTEVVTVDGIAANDLYLRAVNWFKTYFTNPGSVIKENDPAANMINGQHAIYIYNEIDGKRNKEGQVKYRIDIVCKEGRYKYDVHDIFRLASPKVYIEQYLDETAVNKEVQFGYVRQVDTEISEMIVALKKAMQEPVETQSEEEW